MVSEMSSTTQRGAAAAAVEVRRTRAMPRREVRSSILCAALQPCLQGVQCLLDYCNDARLQCYVRDGFRAKSHRCCCRRHTMQSQIVRAMLAACKTLGSKLHLSIIHKMSPRTSSRAVQTSPALQLSRVPSLVRGCPSAKRMQTIAAMES